MWTPLDVGSEVALARTLLMLSKTCIVRSKVNSELTATTQMISSATENRMLNFSTDQGSTRRRTNLARRGPRTVTLRGGLSLREGLPGLSPGTCRVAAGGGP